MSSLDQLRSLAARSNLSSWWGAVTAELLWRFGVGTVVISPGSRSTPLTYACAVHPRLETPVILDERSAAFFALGLAKTRHKAVALLCTSGTAVANYLPAVIEAAESDTPLLVFSADRPPELRYRHAGQTIDQVKVFGDAVRWFAEAMVPEPRLEALRAWRDLLSTAVARTSGPHPGPVHLNCPFRDPLAPGDVADPALPEIDERFFAMAAPPLAGRGSLDLPRDLPADGWIIAGPARPRDAAAYVAAVERLALYLGWPVLADALSPCRHHAMDASVQRVASYDLILRSAGADGLRPAAILQLGELPTSKVLRQKLATWQLPTWIVDPAPDSRNAVAAPAVALRCAVEDLGIPADSQERGSSPLVELEERAASTLAKALAALEVDQEPAIARVVLDATPPETPIFVASSMPVRDAEYFWPVNDDHRPVFFNRGANGIDGTLSSVLGVAQGTGRPAVLYTGELALLHDTNGLLVANSVFSGSLTIVAINNGGGGIFEHLPIAGQGAVFERCFATPQRVDFGRWAAAYGIEHQRIESLEMLRAELKELPPSGVRVLEVRTDRKRDAAWRKLWFAEASRILA